MWSVMMVAMMLPSAAPAIVQVVGRSRRRAGGSSGMLRALFFVAGYLLVWSAFGAAATLLQWALDSAQLLSATMAIRSGVAAGAVVVAAGVYQLTPLKHASLGRCRASAGCFAEDQRESAGMMARQGLRYGVYRQALSTPCLNALRACEGIYLEDLHGRRCTNVHAARSRCGVVRKIPSALPPMPTA